MIKLMTLIEVIIIIKWYLMIIIIIMIICKIKSNTFFYIKLKERLNDIMGRNLVSDCLILINIYIIF